jgi:hypothetical protein
VLLEPVWVAFGLDSVPSLGSEQFSVCPSPSSSSYWAECMPGALSHTDHEKKMKRTQGFILFLSHGCEFLGYDPSRPVHDAWGDF